MKTYLIIICFFACYSNLIFANAFPNKNQFSVESISGYSFYLEENVNEVYKKLGEPMNKENLWVSYPNASCGLYRIDYEGISFLYYDINDKIVKIIINNDRFKIFDNGITIGASYSDIIKSYGLPRKEINLYSESNSLNGIQLKYSTIGTELSYTKQTVLYWYEIAFNFDKDKEKCNLIMISQYGN